MTVHTLDPRREIPGIAHEGDCCDTLCPACGCCCHCAGDGHCQGEPGCTEADCCCPLLGGGA